MASCDKMNMSLLITTIIFSSVDFMYNLFIQRLMRYT